MDVLKKRHITLKEFVGDGFDAKRLFDILQPRILVCLLQQAEKPGLGGMAALSLANQIGEAAGGRQALFDADLARILLDRGILHLHIGEAPLLFGRRNERHQRGVLLVALLEMVGHEIAGGGARPLQLRISGQMDDQNIKLPLIRGGIGSQPFVTVDMLLEGILDVLRGPLLGLGFVHAVQDVQRKLSIL